MLAMGMTCSQSRNQKMLRSGKGTGSVLFTYRGEKRQKSQGDWLTIERAVRTAWGTSHRGLVLLSAVQERQSKMH